MRQSLVSDYISPNARIFKPTVSVAKTGHYRPHRRQVETTSTENVNESRDAEAITKSKTPKFVNNALAACATAGVDVISAAPEWIELRVPCDLATRLSVQKVLTDLLIDVPRETCEAIDFAFSEMLNNAIEYGCRLNAADRIEIRFIRLKRALICRIKDPGDGFDPAQLAHAATCNPSDDPIHHVLVREKKGLRPGGFGILVTSQLVDELVYNERHNELLFVKYLSEQTGVSE